MPDKQASENRPNLLLIMTDQHRGDSLGCDGHPVLETPYLDELAGQGTRFSCAYSATPSCLPARATLLTGQDQWHTGILGMGKGQGAIPNTFVHTLPGELAKAGYHTQSVGKNHFNPQRALNGYHNVILDESGREQTPDFQSDYRKWFEENKTGPYGYRDHSIGWNSWMARPSHLPEHLHPTWWTAQQAIEWLDRRDPSKPFFLKMSFARPHSPYDPPQAYFDMYKDQKLPDPYLGKWSEMHDDPQMAASTSAWRGKRSDTEIHRARAGYYGNVTFIDHQIGRLFYEMTKEHKEALDNTLVIFCSDHGDMLGDHHLWRKTYGYEGSARVPMIVKPPSSWEASGGQVSENIVELRDVMPTFLDAAGVDIPDTVQGQSMLATARGEKPKWRDFIIGEHVWCYSHEQANYYVTDGKKKYIYLPYLGIEQFFDLENDPGECNNLITDSQHKREIATWRQRLIQELENRDTGEVQDGKLVKMPLDTYPTSPHYKNFNCQSDQ